MSGMIGIIAQESARFSMFAASMTELDTPPGTTVKWRFGWDLADAHNALIQEMYDRDAEWLWLMADDHSFSTDTLTRLLAHDVDIVTPLCLMRNPPYRAVNWVIDDEAPKKCECGHGEDVHRGWNGRNQCTLGLSSVAGTPDLCSCQQYDEADRVKRIDLDDYPDGGLQEIAISGAAGMLVKRRVFDKVTFPWFETGTGITNRVGEDVNFCRKARKAGFKLHCDLDTVIGHCCTTVVWPVREPDGWTFAFSMMGGFQVTMPPSFQAYADQIGA